MAEQVVRVGQGERVAKPPGRGQRGLLGGRVVLPPAAPVEERTKRPGDLPSVAVELVGVGVGDQREQHGDLSVEPGHPLLFVCHICGEYAGLRIGERQRGPVRAEPMRGRHGRMQVVVQYPVHSRPTLIVTVMGLRLSGCLLDGICAQQIVESKSARDVLRD